MNYNYNKIVYMDEKRNNTLWIDWTLGNSCNFSCSYCPDNLHDGTANWISLEDCEKFVRKIIVHYSQFNKKYFIFNLLGGEPTVWRNLKKFCILVKEIAAENNVTAIIEILTNGGRTMRWWRSNYHLFDTFKITHHSEFADPRHTKELAEFLYETGNRCSIQVPMLPDNWDVCIRHINVLADTDVPYNLLTKTLLIDFGSNPYPYTDEQKNYIEQAWEGSLEKNIISLSANYDLRNKMDIFIRYDIYDDNKNDTVGKNGNNYLIAGVVFNCGDELSVAPNMRMTSFENESDAVTEYKINFQFKF